MSTEEEEEAIVARKPRWIEVETCEPIYSILGDSIDGDRSANSDDRPQLQGRKRATTRQRLPTVPIKPPIPYRTPPQDQDCDTEAIYSVVNKSNRIRASIEKLPEDEGKSRREVLENWLRIASRERSAMYSGDADDSKDAHDWRRDNGNCASTPRGIVGLVGPYRIHQNQSQDQGSDQYILEEEELVEEIVDSVSEVAAQRREDYERAKWDREDDTETLVPDDEKLKEASADKAKDSSNWKLREVAVKYGKEERAVDVPDGASAVSTATGRISDNNNNNNNSAKGKVGKEEPCEKA